MLVEKMKIEKVKKDGEIQNLEEVIKTLQDDIHTLQQEREHELKGLQTVQRENQALKAQLHQQQVKAKVLHCQNILLHHNHIIVVKYYLIAIKYYIVAVKYYTSYT